MLEPEDLLLLWELVDLRLSSNHIRLLLEAASELFDPDPTPWPGNVLG